MTPTEMPRSVLLAGGGTAGHVSPLLSLADCLRRRDPDVAITVVGTAGGLEARLVPARGYELATIPKVPLPRRPDPSLLRLPGNLLRAVGRAGEIIDASRAEVVVGFGGYVSTPVYLAARRRRVPIAIHEQNAVAGIANKVGARLTRHVGVTFAQTDLAHGQVVGMPLRREIAVLDRAGQRSVGRTHFGLREDLPTVLVTGGSLGAQRLNEAFAGSVGALREAGVQVLHVTGEGKELRPEGCSDDVPYVVVPYVDRMDLAYAAADVAVCRSGANTVCEMTAVGLPACYVPLPIGNGEQRLNARDVVAAGGGTLTDDALVTPAWVREQVIPLVTDKGRVAAMSSAAASIGEPDADELLADLVLTAWRSGPGESR